MDIIGLFAGIYDAIAGLTFRQAVVVAYLLAIFAIAGVLLNDYHKEGERLREKKDAG